MRGDVARGLKLLIVMALVSAACDSPGSPAAAKSGEPSAHAPSTAATTSSGVKACDEYIGVASACLGKLPEADREALRISVEQFRNQLSQATSEAARQAVAIGCEAELEALRQDNTCP